MLIIIKDVSSNLEDDLEMSTSEAVYEQFMNYISYADMYTQLSTETLSESKSPRHGQ